MNAVCLEITRASKKSDKVSSAPYQSINNRNETMAWYKNTSVRYVKQLEQGNNKETVP